MRLDPIYRDYRENLDEFSAAIDAADTRFYLDTSLLMWLIRIGATARSEFIAWCGGLPSGSVRIPVWAAHELHRHIGDQTTSKNIAKIISAYDSTCRDFSLMAAERADDASCMANGFTGRQEYIATLARWDASLDRLKKGIAPNRELMGQATKEVIEFANIHLLTTDLDPIVDRLARVGEFRAKHRMPPGFKDDAKQENNYGDVVIWEEILQDLTSNDPGGGVLSRDAILISRDSKTDWVSSAVVLIDEKGKTSQPDGNRKLDVKLAHPLLVHEFTGRARGKRLFVAPPDFLSSTLYHRKKVAGVRSWFEAAHSPSQLNSLVSAMLAKAVASSSPSPAAAPTTTTTTGPKNSQKEVEAVPAFQHLSVAGLLGTPTASELGAYDAAAPAEKEQVVADWVGQISVHSMSPRVLGKLLSELSERSEPGWPAAIHGLITTLGETASNAVLNEIVLVLMCSTYFDKNGDLRKKPLNAMGNIVLEFFQTPLYKAATGRLRELLTDQEAQLPWVPSSENSRVEWRVLLESESGKTHQRLKEIRISNYPATVDLVSTNARSLSTLLQRTGDQGCTGLELRMLIANQFLIPPIALSTEFDGKKIAWASEIGLLSVDTSSEGGLQVEPDEENRND